MASDGTWALAIAQLNPWEALAKGLEESEGDI